jgi:CubicO group peptidase (beta-lactamase class C family)
MYLTGAMKRRIKMKRFVKRIAAFGLAASLTVGSVAGLYAAEPVRSTFEAAGGEVSWDAGSRLIEIEVLGSQIVLEPSSNVAFVNGAAVQLSQPVVIEGGRAYIEAGDIDRLVMAMMGVEIGEGEHAMAVATAEAIISEFAALVPFPDIGVAIVNANTGFNFTTTMSDSTNADSIWHIGSIGKTFTAVAIMQLVEQGILDLDTPVVNYLPDFSVLPSAGGVGNSDNITVRMLLNHTSGIPLTDGSSGIITRGGHHPAYMNEFVERLATQRMISQEGTVHAYANNGYTLLGILIAYVMGHDNLFEGLNQHMHDYIFDPMGLTRTSLIVTPALRPHMVDAYWMAGVPREFYYWNPLASGTMFTTANEMVSLMTMLLNGGYYNGVQIISPASIDQMWTIEYPATTYGLGIAFMPDPTGSGFIMEGHNGGLIHNFAAMFIDREHGVGVFSATNSTISMGLNEALTGAVLGTAVAEMGGEISTAGATLLDPAATPVEMSLAEMEALAGLYTAAGGLVSFYLEVVDGQMLLHFPAQGLVMTLTPMSDGHFLSDIGIPFWFTERHGTIVLTQGANRDAETARRVDITEFIPDDDFMENWNDFTFVAVPDNDLYVVTNVSFTYGVTDFGVAYMMMELLQRMEPMLMLVSMTLDYPLQYENGEYFFIYNGVRMVRQ